MASRPAFVPRVDGPPYFAEVKAEFEWFPGFAISQAQRSVASFHDALEALGHDPTLEISTKSPTRLGVELSAFNLTLVAGDLELSVECAFQGSKVFRDRGPFHDLYRVSSREAKKDARLRVLGDVLSFDYLGDVWPNKPPSAFYDWLYLTALVQNPSVADDLCGFNSFTDIAFNPKKSLSCQARSAAIFVGLTRAGQLDEALDGRDRFLSVVYPNSLGESEQSRLL